MVHHWNQVCKFRYEAKCPPDFCDVVKTSLGYASFPLRSRQVTCFFSI
jgi:hypothetical protein